MSSFVHALLIIVLPDAVPVIVFTGWMASRLNTAPIDGNLSWRELHVHKIALDQQGADFQPGNDPF